MGEGEGGRGEKRKVFLLQLSPFFASIFPLFPQKRLILRLVLYDGCYSKNNKKPQGHEGGVDIC